MLETQESLEAESSDIKKSLQDHVELSGVDSAVGKTNHVPTQRKVQNTRPRLHEPRIGAHIFLFYKNPFVNEGDLWTNTPQLTAYISVPRTTDQHSHVRTVDYM